MKRIYAKLWLGLATAFMVAGVEARPITNDEAAQVASSFLAERGKTGGIVLKNVTAETRAGTGEASYYVFNVGKKEGFVVVANSDRASSGVLCYTQDGSFQQEEMPPAMQNLLQTYAQQLQKVEKREAVSAAIVQRAPVQPLLATTWGQETPYNNRCPQVTGEIQRSLTGCAATSMAQVMRYYQWPAQTSEPIPSYTITVGSNLKQRIGSLPVTTFDWSNMQNSYPSGSTAEANAMATLMEYAGKSIQTTYSVYNSTAYPSDIAPALRRYFNYDKSTHYITRGCYTAAAWDSIIYNELAARRPVILDGARADGTDNYYGHSFVCDGTDGQGYYHINWGWGGRYNGYFRLSLLNALGNSSTYDDGTPGFSFNMDAIVGIRPAVYGESSPPYVLSSLGIESDVASVTAGSDGMVTYNLTLYFANYEATTTPYTLSVAFFDSQGRQVDAVTVLDAAPYPEDYYAKKVSFVRRKLPDGVYSLRLFCNADGFPGAQPLEGAAIWNISMRVLNNMVTFFDDTQTFTFDNLQVTGNHRVGQAQTVSVSVSNSGQMIGTPLFLFQRKEFDNGEQSFVMGKGVYIDKGVTDSVAFRWIPVENGDYTLTLCLDDKGEQVVARLPHVSICQGGHVSAVVLPSAGRRADDDAIFNLNGVKMNAASLPPGVYIKGGRKMIVQ